MGIGQKSASKLSIDKIKGTSEARNVEETQSDETLWMKSIKL